jgi:hypothetical protein
VLGAGVEVPATLVSPLLFLVLLLGAFTVALVGVVLSARHTRLVEGSAYAATARRFVPWVATWVLILGIVFAGYLALIVPGVYLALRLFWADEFALIHGKGPIAALKASWDLTRGRAGAMFVFQFVLGLAQYVILLPALLGFVFLMAGLEAAGLTGGDVITGLETFLVFVLGALVYGGLHGPEIVQFYGMRAQRANLEAGLAPVVPTRNRTLVAAIVGSVFVLWVLIVAAIAIPNLLNAIDRGKGKRTLADSRDIAIAIESYAETNELYPQAGSLEELRHLLVPAHAQSIPVVDGWGHPFQVVSDSDGYEIRSAAKDGLFESAPPRGATSSFGADIVWRNGEVVQWPDHVTFE